MDWFNNPINVHGGTYGIDLFFTELENSIGGNIYVNHQNAEGGFLELLTYDYDYDYYYYYGEDSLYFENYTYINQDGLIKYGMMSRDMSGIRFVVNIGMVILMNIKNAVKNRICFSQAGLIM